MQHRAERKLTRTTGFRRAAALTVSILLVTLGMVTQAGTSTAEGNNGTVKIDGWTLDHGTGNGAPNRNEPHLDCEFDVEWYNFDADVVSTVTFEMQAPTLEVGLSGTAPATVQLDGDDDSGASAAGLDAVQHYSLAFDGAAHPEHGYHVKLTVNTPDSNGADVKHKVFWVEGCESEPTPITPAPTVVASSCPPDGGYTPPVLIATPVEGATAGPVTYSGDGDGEWEPGETASVSYTADDPSTTFLTQSHFEFDFLAEWVTAEDCDVEPAELEVPAEPEVSDPCGVGNAEWIVPEDDETLAWQVVDGDLVVTILVEDTVFVGTGETTHSFGPAVETNVEECEVAGEQLEIPATPGMRDPCGAGNAAWVVPADTDSLNWDLAGSGVLTVDITVPDTVFEGTQDTTWSFGRVEETNTAACPVQTEVEVLGAQVTVPGAVDAGLGPVGPASGQRNPWWLLAVGGGLGLMGAAGWRRRWAAHR